MKKNLYIAITILIVPIMLIAIPFGFIYAALVGGFKTGRGLVSDWAHK